MAREGRAGKSIFAVYPRIRHQNHEHTKPKTQICKTISAQKLTKDKTIPKRMVANARRSPTNTNGRITPNATPNDESVFTTKNILLHSSLYLSPHPEPLRYFSDTINNTPGKKINGTNARPENRLPQF
jgi:hypothetical protein